jgi:flagellum-specific peptidoglycan hydrolase FlgJ
MTKYFPLILLVFTLNCVTAQVSYIKKFTPMVDSLAAIYSIPKSIIMGVSIIESGMGKDRNPKLLNNYFGFVGKNNLLKSKGIRTKYKQYNSAAESFADFCGMITRRKYYKTLKGNNNYVLWLNAMASAGYSENPSLWKSLITGAIQKYKLDKL